MCNFRIFPKIAAFWENPEKNWSNLAKFSKFWQNLKKIVKNLGLFGALLQPPAPEKKNQQKFQQFLTNKLRLEIGAKKCIV